MPLEVSVGSPSLVPVQGCIFVDCSHLTVLFCFYFFRSIDMHFGEERNFFPSFFALLCMNNRGRREEISEIILQ